MPTLTRTPNLDRIDWDAVAAAARAGGDGGAGAASPRTLADAMSLSALFAPGFAGGLARIDEARAAEPLNPIHEARLALHLLRFGESARALAVAQSLQDQVPGAALPGYLRALATLAEGESKRAANVAGDVVSARPAFGPARFLQAEAQLRAQFKGLRRHLAGLPRGPEHAPSWADLVVKLVLSRGEEAGTLAAEIADDPALLPAGSRERALASKAIEMARSGVESLEDQLAAAPPGSRLEELLLLFYRDRLGDDRTPEAAVEAVRRLLDRLPGRRAIRRLYVERLTRLAMGLATGDRLAEALRLVERCLRLEPHEPVHYQNRAALFTLLREQGPYHDAWADLDRHRCRLALLGRIGEGDAVALAKPHRLFAQQARLPGAGPGQGLGFLKQSARTEGGTTDIVLSVNQERIDDDPDLLRQWLHHRGAELTFTHLALGTDPRRFLLDPPTAPEAESRRVGLGSLARSLGTLAGEEGRMLAGRLVAAWDLRAARLDPAYAARPDDPEARSVGLLHLETLADLALLCLQWKPDGLRPALAEEVLATLEAEGPFFDDGLLREVLQGKHGEPSYAVKLLSGFLHDALGLDPGLPAPLTARQRADLIGRLAAELLVRLAYRSYEARRGMGDAAERALTFVGRARRHAPEVVRNELSAARFLLLAGHDDEAKATLDAIQRSARGREPEVHSEVEELRKVLDERSKAGTRSRPLPPEADVAPADGPSGALVADLEGEIERFPASIQAYEELARRLAADGRFPEAIDWSGRAIAHCLGRDGQVRARSLDMEMLGLRLLSGLDRGAVRLYLAGAHRPALEILEGVPEGEPLDYTMHYLLANCRLALGHPEEASRSYEQALEGCGRQLHRTVLKGLAGDVDQPYLAVARRVVADRLDAGAFEDALRAAWEMLGRLRRPEPAFVDLAQVHLDAAVARLGADLPPLPSPAEGTPGARDARLVDAYAAGSDLERARRLARLAVQSHEPSRRKAELILRKAEALGEQAALAEVLATSGALLRLGKFAEALAALDAAGPAGSGEPRLIRQRALLLLKLDRFDEADALAASLKASTTPVALEFLASYPALAFRQRVAEGCRLLRSGEAAEALRVFDRAEPADPDGAVELAYCRGFGLTMEAYRLRRAGLEGDARTALALAMDRVAPQVAAARASGHSRLIDLYDTLDKELDR